MGRTEAVMPPPNGEFTGEDLKRELSSQSAAFIATPQATWAINQM